MSRIQEKNKGKLIIISSPSGAGKTSITKKLLEIYDNLKLSVSVTTRQRRENEIEGKDYFFVNNNQFQKLIDDQDLLEHATVFNHFYGTPKKFVREELEKGNNIIFDIDWQGAEQISKHKEFDIISIFILPPSIEALKERLTNRGLDSEEIINVRMSQAKTEISHFKDYKYVVLNDDFDRAVEEIRGVIEGGEESSKDYSEFVNRELLK